MIKQKYSPNSLELNKASYGNDVAPKEALYYNLMKSIGDDFTYSISEYSIDIMKSTKVKGELFFSIEYLKSHEDEKIYFIWFYHTLNYNPTAGIWFHPERIMMDGPEKEEYIAENGLKMIGKKRCYVKSMDDAIEKIKNNINNYIT